ncbi:MFS transporter [Streptomyces sp. FH025]|uniref:MFS transporter n=1 Tax=Streptomyces sp. FH025 TaxID=2815937 RepID=UPI001A9EF832|nr:MFS transporter [Streptomyces sp. FH025]MBO1414911.1 MFS transporter [Streptomyces sp. FH025]
MGPTPGWPLGGLLSLSAAVFLALTTEMLPAGVLPPVARDLGVSEDTAGLLVTAFAYAMALGAIPLTALTRALPRRSLMVALMAGFAVVNVLTAVSGSFALTAAVRTAGGLLAGVFWSTAAAYAARLVAPERVGRAVAIVFAGQAVALTAGVPFGTAVGSAIGWRTAFGGLAVLALLLSVLVARFLPARPGDRARGGTRVGAVLRTPGVLVVSGTTLVVMLGQFAVYTYVATLLEGAGLGGAAIGWALLAYGAAGAVGVGAAATLVDRRPRAAVLGGLGLLEGAVLVLAVAGRSTVLVLVAVAAWGLAFGALPTLLHAAVVRAAPAAPEVADSVLNSGFNIGIGTGAILGGQVLARAGIGAVPWTALALLVAGAAVALAARRTGFPELRAGESG